MRERYKKRERGGGSEWEREGEIRRLTAIITRQTSCVEVLPCVLVGNLLNCLSTLLTV